MVGGVNKFVADSNAYNADTTQEAPMLAAAAFLKRVVYHGAPITPDMLRTMYSLVDLTTTLELVTTATDAAVAVWREHLVFADGTTFDTREASIFRFDLKTCEAISLDQIYDNSTETAIWTHYAKMAAAGNTVTRRAHTEL